MIHIKKLIDEAKCYETVREMRWQDSVRCPGCESAHVSKEGRDERQPCAATLSVPRL
jgi:hypothetical protein